MDTEDSGDEIPRSLPQYYTKPQTAYQDQMQNSHAKPTHNQGNQKILNH